MPKAVNQEAKQGFCIENVTFGADPELFIIDKSRNNKIISSIGLIPGEKGKAWRSDDMPEGFGLEIDNILAEFNIPPCRTKRVFVDSIEYMKNFIREFVKKTNKSFDIMCASSAHVDENQLQSDEAKLFGCSPDFNAYTCQQNPAPEGDKTNLRSTGFHVHIGYDNPNVEASVELIKYLDMYVGINSVILDPDKERRNLYGKAGSFRLTSYGCEYRVLSGAMYRTKELTGMVFDLCCKAIEAFNSGTPLIPSNMVIDCINNSDVELAKRLRDNYML